MQFPNAEEFKFKKKKIFLLLFSSLLSTCLPSSFLLGLIAFWFCKQQYNIPLHYSSKYVKQVLVLVCPLLFG